MVKSGCLIITILMMTFSLSWSDSGGFTVEGEIRDTGEQGDVRFRLVDKGAFEDPADSGHFRMGGVLPVQAGERSGEGLAFVLENVPAGTYALQAFQDVNGNGKLDMGIFGPKEPWGNYRSSRPGFRAPTFEECAFDVNSSLTGIIIELK